jgi:hypothetical protein
MLDSGDQTEVGWLAGPTSMGLCNQELREKGSR